MEIFPIRNDDDHRRALIEIDRLWAAPDDSPEADCMDALATLVVAYEERRWPMEAVSPVDTIKFYMEQNDRIQKDLAELFGSRSRASEVLNGRRALSLEQIRLLHAKWRIPADLLIGDPINA